MAIYNPKSMKAEEFINDGEILETLEYAEKNKNNIELINSILDKARPVKIGNETRCAGLTHREASVLLACEIPEKVNEPLVGRLSSCPVQRFQNAVQPESLLVD